MSDSRRDYLMLQGLALLAARFLAYVRSRGLTHWKVSGVSARSVRGAMLCLAIAVSNLEEAAAWLLEPPQRRKKK